MLKLMMKKRRLDEKGQQDIYSDQRGPAQRVEMKHHRLLSSKHVMSTGGFICPDPGRKERVRSEGVTALL